MFGRNSVTNPPPRFVFKEFIRHFSMYPPIKYNSWSQEVTQEAAACWKFSAEVPETGGGVEWSGSGSATGREFNEEGENPLLGLGLKFSRGAKP